MLTLTPAQRAALTEAIAVELRRMAAEALAAGARPDDVYAVLDRRRCRLDEPANT